MKAGAVSEDDTQAAQAETSEFGLSGEPDHVLAALIGGGDEAAYSVLVLRHASRHLAIAERVLGNRQEAEDAVQEAFTKLWRHAGRYQPDKAKFTTWFYRIVVNQCLDRKRRKTPVALPEGYDVVDDRDGPDGELDQSQRAARVKAALMTLPTSQRTAITLCYFEGVTNKEAAEILDLNVKALESLLTRGRRKLAGLLKAEMYDLAG